MRNIRTRKGLEKLLQRYIESNADKYWLNVIEDCIKEDLAMDETDYENTPEELKSLWRGLK